MYEKMVNDVFQQGSFVFEMNVTYIFDEVLYDIKPDQKLLILLYNKQSGGTYDGLLVRVFDANAEFDKYKKEWMLSVPCCKNHYYLKEHLAKVNKFVVITKDDLINRVIFRKQVYRKDLERYVNRDEFTGWPITIDGYKINRISMICEFMKGGLIIDERKQQQQPAQPEMGCELHDGRAEYSEGIRVLRDRIQRNGFY